VKAYFKFVYIVVRLERIITINDNNYLKWFVCLIVLNIQYARFYVPMYQAHYTLMVNIDYDLHGARPVSK